MLHRMIQRAVLVLALSSHFYLNEVASFVNTNYRTGLASVSTASRFSTACCSSRNPSLMIDDVLRGNATAAASIISALAEVRGTDTMEEYLGEMMPPDLDNLPIWARLPLSKYSRRARQLRLRKLLELSTPSPDDASDDDEEAKKRRGRRALFVLLRNIADDPNNYRGIKGLLAEVKKDAQNVVIMSPNELRKRTPDLETPKYEVLKTTPNGLEIRRYEQFSVCSVTMKDLNSKSGSDKESATKLSNPQLSGATSFGALAGYLFGKNQSEKTMKMTTPVLTEGTGDEKKMSFVLPSDYWSVESLRGVPKPMSDSAVKITNVEGSLRAVIAFGGYGGKFDAMSAKLRDLLEKDEEWSAAADAPITLAQYNDPFTPPWKRRNEVSVVIVPREPINN